MAATKKAGLVKEYLLIDPFGDPIYVGSADEVKVFLEDILDSDETLDACAWKLRVLGQEVSMDVERIVQVTIGGA